MKPAIKNIFTTTLCIAAYSALFADEVTIAGKYTNTTGQRNSITGVNADTNLILDATPNKAADKGEMFRATGGKIVKTITAIDSTAADGKGKVNIASYGPTDGITVDVNSAADITAISAASWAQNFMLTTVKNSNADYKKANVLADFGSQLTIDSGAVTQGQTMIFEHFKGTVKATKTVIGLKTDAESKLWIKENSDVSWAGRLESSMESHKAGFVQIDGTLTVQSKTGNFVFKGGQFNIGEKGVFRSLDNWLSIDTGTTSNVYGKLEMGGGSKIFVNGTLNIHNTKPVGQLKLFMVESNGTFNQATASTNNGVRFVRKAELFEGANWNVDQIVDLFGERMKDVDLGTTRAILDIKSGAHIVVNEVSGVNARIRLWGNSELNLHQTNAFKDQNGKGIRIATALDVNSDLGSVMNVYSEQTFEDIYITSGSALDIKMQNDLAKLIFEGEGRTVSIGKDGELRIYNFRENSIYVGTNSETISELAKARFYDSGKNLLNVRVNESGWLTAVPEPAEWAAIFGAIALGLALYRRRK